MRPTFWQRLDQMARNLTPLALTLLLVILNIVPTHIPGLGRVLPLLPLIAVFHWTVHRPHLMPAMAVFIVGLVQDALSGAPMGLHAVIFLVVQAVVLFQHRFFTGKSFFIHWLGFALIGAGAMALAWLVLSAYHVALVAADTMVFQYALTVATFPLLASFFWRWQQAFLKLD